jgi:methylthioribulose-1-phosphate dehydratase
MSSDEADALVISSDPLHVRLLREMPANLISELCAGFYRLGWVTGTGGGISIRVRWVSGYFDLTSDEVSPLLIFLGWVRNARDKVYIAPTGVQKERIEPSHMFVLPYPQASPSPRTGRIFLRRPKLMPAKTVSR